MKLSSKFTRRYLTAEDLPTGRLPVTIAEFTEEWMGNPRELKTVAYFNEIDKGLVVKPPHATTLQKAFGDETDDMVGKLIHLVVVRVEINGEMRNVVGIEVPAVQPARRPTDAELNRRLDEEAAIEPPPDSETLY